MRKLLLIILLFSAAGVYAQPMRLLLAKKSASGGTFSPSNLTGLILWLKADQISGTDGSAVATWFDQSPSGNNATATGTAQPTLKTNILGGKPVVRFNGTSNVMTLTTSFFSTGTVFCVQRKTATKFVSLSTSSTGNTPYLVYQYSDGTDYSSNINQYIGFAGTAAGVFNYWSIILPSSGTGTNTVYKNGTLLTSNTVSGVATSTNFSLIGARGTEYGDGDLAEIIYYNNILSTTDRQKVETYLKNKYGL